MAISTAAAILGAAVIGGGGAAMASRSASRTAANAANYAADRNAEVNQRIYDQTRADLAPYNQAGNRALTALMSRLGLSPQAYPSLMPSQPSAQPYGGNAGQTNMSNPAYFSPTANKPTGGPAGTSPAIPYDPAMDAFPMSPNSVGTGGPPIAGMGGGYGQPTYNATPTPDWNGYLAANPDVAAQAQREGRDPVEYAQAHYAAFGQSEGRNLPMTQPGPVNPGQPEQPPMTPQQEGDMFGVRPEDMAVPTYARPDVGSAPSLSTYIDPAKFQVDPGYQFRLSEGINAVNAGSAARRLLRSGDAAKALQARGEGLANQGFNDWYNRQLQAYQADADRYRFNTNRTDQNFVDDRSYGTNLWNTRQNRTDNLFSEDRGFRANRYDVNTGNLFNVVGIGQGAAAGTASAGNNYAANATANNNARANTIGNAAIANAGVVSNLFGSAANAAGTYFGMRGMGGGFGGGSGGYTGYRTVNGMLT